MSTGSGSPIFIESEKRRDCQRNKRPEGKQNNKLASVIRFLSNHFSGSSGNAGMSRHGNKGFFDSQCITWEALAVYLPSMNRAINHF
jgi:hypothetical protein